MNPSKSYVTALHNLSSHPHSRALHLKTKHFEK